MKYLLIIFLATLSSCTYKFNAELTVPCPCIIERRVQTMDNEGYINYRVKVRSLNDSGKYFAFNITHPYQIGDTIK